MIPNAKECLYPSDPQEASRLLAEHGKKALILAGGTTAALSKDANIEFLVDITRMGFDSIESSGGEWSLGCNVRIQQLADHEQLAGLWSGMLVESARAVGSHQIRNAITLGGNLVQLYRWSDPPVALFAMGAVFDLIGPEGARSLSAEEFFERHPRMVLKPAELLVKIRIPEPQGVCVGAFTKYAKTEVDLAVIDAAACLVMDGDRCSSARVVIGAARGTPFRSAAAEKVLTGKKPTKANIAKAALAARESAKVTGDVRAKKEYRESMLEVIVRRTIERALARI